MKKILSILLSCSLIFASQITDGLQNLTTAVAETSETSETTETETYYSPLNNYYYQTDAYLYGSPDSVEFRIRMPEASFGGTVFAVAQGHSYCWWHIDAAGKLSFRWKRGAVSYTFTDSENLADDEWHHVALVRSDSAFTYYLDGEVEGVCEIATERDYIETAYNIGAHKVDGNGQSAFDGFITQVAVYDGSITQEQVVADMNDECITSEDTVSEGATLLGSWNLDEYWTERSYPATEAGVPKVDLHTYEKFVDMEYDFEYDYTFAIVPDIQCMTNYNLPRLNNSMQWLVDNKERLNLQFACFVGDLSDFGQREYLYERAAAAMSRLDNVVPYCFVPGNHDYDNNASTRKQVYYDTHFPVSKHSQLPGFGGVFEEGSMANSWYTFNACGIDYLVMNIEYKPRYSVLRWANAIIETHPNHRVMINTHDYYNVWDMNIGDDETVYDCDQVKALNHDVVLKHENVFFAFGGHTNNDEAVYRISTGENGNQVINMCLDMQVARCGDDRQLDVLMLVHVNEEEKKLYFSYYSPENEKVYNIQNLFCIPFGDENNPTIGA